jgi:hypothetical protein
MSDIKLIILKNGEAFDVSELVLNVKWTGRKGAAARSISVNFIDDERHGRTGIDVAQGHQCVFYWKNQELFRGMFMKQEQSNAKTMTATAYDAGIYLANNKDTFNYTNKKASDIFIDCCKRFGLKYGEVADTRHRIPELPKPKTTAWDVICDALSLTFESTGVRFYPLCVGEEMRLLERRENILQWAVETGVNLEDYKFSQSIEKIKTRIKMLSKENAVLAEASDPELERKIGKFQDVESAKDDMNQAQLNTLVNTKLRENNMPERTFSVTALGQPDIITGVGVFIIIEELGVSKTYYVEEDTHEFQGNYHKMTLKLELAADVKNQIATGTSGGAYRIKQM